MARITKSLSPSHYGASLDLVADALQDSVANYSRLVALIELSGLLMRESPEGKNSLNIVYSVC